MTLLPIRPLRLWILWAFCPTIGVLLKGLFPMILLLILRMFFRLPIHIFITSLIIVVMIILRVTVIVWMFIFLFLILFILIIPIRIAMLPLHHMLLLLLLSLFFLILNKLLIVNFLFIQITLRQTLHHLPVFFGLSWRCLTIATIFAIELALELLLDPRVDIWLVQNTLSLVVAFPDVFFDAEDLVGLWFVQFL